MKLFSEIYNEQNPRTASKPSTPWYNQGVPEKDRVYTPDAPGDASGSDTGDDTGADTGVDTGADTGADTGEGE